MSVTLFGPATVTAPALVLRAWQRDDVRDLAAAFQDPMLRRFLRTRIDSEADARQWIDRQVESWPTGARLSFAVVERNGDEATRMVGHISIRDLRPGSTRAEVGYWTVADARGRGVASRALETLSRWAFTAQRVTTLDRLDLIHATTNRASCRVAEKCGFTLRSVLAPQPPDHPHDGHLHVRPRPAI